MIDLVCGYAKGYDAEQIRPFLKSLRNSGYEGKILLFANGGAAEEASKWDVDIRPVPNPRMKVHSARFICIAEALSDIDCEGILLADTRDIIFQKDPSESLSSTGLHVYEEDHSQSLGSCPYNSLWLDLGYGKQILDKLSTYPISCVGTTHGDRGSMLFYLEKLVEQIKNIQPNTNHPQDQAAHNYIIREKLIDADGVYVWGNEEGEIYTVGYIKPFGTVKFKDNLIINQSGKVPAVIHQWDRHPNLTALVKCIL
jgi:hypothetical protein